MDIGPWEEPIPFETERPGQYRTITNTDEARVLTGQWPVDTGKALEEARRTCLAVLEGKEGPAAARKAFIRAADEAGVFIR